MVDLKRLGANLRALRKQRHWKLRHIAEKASLSISYISDLERGKTEPSLTVLDALCRAYGVNISELLDGVFIDAVNENETAKAAERPILNQEQLEWVIREVARALEARRQTNNLPKLEQQMPATSKVGEDTYGHQAPG